MKKDRKNLLPGAALIALAAAVIVYLIMLNVEKNMLSDYEKGTVLIAKDNISKGELLRQENVSECFAMVQMEKALIPEAAVKSEEELYEKIVRTDMDKGSVITDSMLEDMNELLAGMEEPVVAGFKADDLYQVVSGTLRGGDRIHIYTMDEEAHNASLVWEDVFVKEVFDSSGGSIEAQDKDSAAQRVNILLEKDSIEQFYSQLSAGTLRVVKQAD